jgi:hypothetical protein
MRITIKNFKSNRVQIFGLVVLLILFVTNPSLNAFRDYAGINSTNQEYNLTRRIFNGYIFSVYGIGGKGYSSKVIGILGNFITISETVYD